jgi:acetylornithine deacetylase/succinyl-diaminopimelate desuccinylase-like protein
MPASDSRIAAFWDEKIVPALIDFIRIPNQSPLFDPEWSAHGHMDRAVKLVTDWIGAQGLQGAQVEVLREGTRTPLILLEVAGTGSDTVLLYGHVDKQPPFTGWREGLGPWTPVLQPDGKLYGRGGADDGYAAFAIVAALKALQQAQVPHGRMLALIECSEESGSPDLPHYLSRLQERIGEPGLIVCLDSGCGDYDRLWSTTSLRGMVTATLRVDLLSEGVHSGLAGGVVPGAFMVARALLARLENAGTGAVLPAALQAQVPPARLAQARKAAQVLGGSVAGSYPWLPGVRPLGDDPVESILNNTWRASLSVTGADGLPPTDQAGNVQLPGLALKISIRIPPTVKPQAAAAEIKRLLEERPPFGAKVSVSATSGPGWDAPPLASWLERATDEASRQAYGREACYFGVGGSIPFMHMLGEQYPRTQFLVTGVLGPNSNAHGPNEFLHVPYAKRLTQSLVHILTGHARRADYT